MLLVKHGGISARLGHAEKENSSSNSDTQLHIRPVQLSRPKSYIDTVAKG